MSAHARIAAFVAGLALAFGGGAALGAAAGPEPRPDGGPTTTVVHGDDHGTPQPAGEG
ncbi:MAG TPA: hypothetical protein VFZ77_04900 [Acidimicrobiales bacterium]